MKVTILRGASGVGKSTYINNHCKDNSVIVSADHYFLTLNPETKEPEYIFNPALLPQAHSRCLNIFIDLLNKKFNNIVVDNTNICTWEYKNYLDLALNNGYEVKIVEFDVKYISTIETLAKRNVHKVPAEVISKMLVNFEPYEGDDPRISVIVVPVDIKKRKICLPKK
jgi:predicted kinase